MGLAGIAIRTPVLAAAIGIDRPIEADIGTVVAGDDGDGLFQPFMGLERRQRILVLAVPAVVEILALFAFEAPAGIGLGAAPAIALLGYQVAPDQIGIRRSRQTL